MSAFFEASLEHRIGGFALEVELALDRGIGVLFGPSAAGKSLTLRLIAGLIHPQKGTIRLGTRFLLKTPGGAVLPAHKRKIGLVHQDLSLFPHLTVLENVAYGLRRNVRAAGYWLEKMRLTGVENRYPRQLSGGQQQRVALARALAPRPELLLLDEPFSALDGPLKRSLRRELKELQRETDIPVLYVTHQIEDVCALGSTVFLLRSGRIVRSFPVEELWQAGSQASTWPALGWGTLIRGKVVQRAGGTWLSWTGGSLELPAMSVEQGAAVAFVPPREIKILYPDLPVDPQLAVNLIEGRIVERYVVGHTCTLYVDGAGLHWHIEYPADSYTDLRLEEGSSVRIGVRPAAVSLLTPQDTEKTGSSD
ncbi:MAG: ABC transporter ATP-binding protein [Spirochaetaceae bacterium]|nr:MAG: ABC transporter ATP-binding protein [Spirochaetaceae bacterium]